MKNTEATKGNEMTTKTRTIDEIEQDLMNAAATSRCYAEAVSGLSIVEDATDYELATVMHILHDRLSAAIKTRESFGHELREARMAAR